VCRASGGLATSSLEYGYRYTASMTSGTSNFILGEDPGQPGYFDARAITISPFDQQLYAASGDGDSVAAVWPYHLPHRSRPPHCERRGDDGEPGVLRR